MHSTVWNQFQFKRFYEFWNELSETNSLQAFTGQKDRRRPHELCVQQIKRFFKLFLSLTGEWVLLFSQLFFLAKKLFEFLVLSV